MSTSARFMIGAILSEVTEVRLFVYRLVMTDPSAASTRPLPAGVWLVSDTGSASSSDAEFRATRPEPPIHGSIRPASSAPATTMVIASFAIRRVRVSAFCDIAGQGTCPEAPDGGVSRGALGGPVYGVYRSACRRPGR